MVGGVSDEEPEEAPVEVEASGEEPVGNAEAQEEVAADAPIVAEEAPAEEQVAEVESEPEPESEEPQEAPVEPEVPVAVEESPSEEEDRPSAA